MVDGRRRLGWWYTAHVMAVIAEVNRDPDARSEPYSASDFPYPGDDMETKVTPPAPPPTEAQMAALSRLYPKR